MKESQFRLPKGLPLKYMRKTRRALNLFSFNIAIHYLKRDYGSSDQNLDQEALLIFSRSESTESKSQYNEKKKIQETCIISLAKKTPLSYFNSNFILNLLSKETGSVFKHIIKGYFYLRFSKHAQYPLPLTR